MTEPWPESVGKRFPSEDGLGLPSELRRSESKTRGSKLCDVEAFQSVSAADGAAAGIIRLITSGNASESLRRSWESVGFNLFNLLPPHPHLGQMQQRTLKSSAAPTALPRASTASQKMWEKSHRPT